MKAAKHRFAVLDAWRGVAACLIVLVHFTGWPGLNSHFNGIALIRNSWMMVDFFFVLSGFVISHAAFGKISNVRTATTFLIRRFGRLWPLHATMLAVFVAFALAKSVASHGAVPAFGPYNSLASVFYNLLMIQSLGVQPWPMWNTPSWSISVEFYTYFVFVGVCLLAIHKRLSTIGPSLILILLSLAMLVPAGDMTPSSIFRCIYGFFVGHLTYLFWRRHKSRLPAMEWFAMGLAVTFVYLSTIRPLQFFAPIVFALVVWVFAEEGGQISRLGKTIVMQNLGAWSYSIYMTHWLGVYLVTRFFPWMDARFGTHTVFYVIAAGSKDVAMPVIAMPNYWVGDVAALVFLVMIVLFSSVTYRYIENPARDYFNKLAGGSGIRVSKSSSVV